MQIRCYAPNDEDAVVQLWEDCGLIRPWNDPRKDIARKLGEHPELFLLGTVNGVVMASIMIGYEGHRGWVNYLAVATAHRQQAIGRRLMQEAEQRLTALGCPKLSLLVRSSNAAVLAFYERLGYAQDEVVALGKRLIVDGPAAL